MPVRGLLLPNNIKGHFNLDPPPLLRIHVLLFDCRIWYNYTKILLVPHIQSGFNFSITLYMVFPFSKILLNWFNSICFRVWGWGCSFYILFSRLEYFLHFPLFSGAIVSLTSIISSDVTLRKPSSSSQVWAVLISYIPIASTVYIMSIYVVIA